MSSILNSQTIESCVLTHELQLGEHLNRCVHSERRSDFGLMLAMLSNDIRAQSQFLLPQHKNTSTEITNEKLRKEFQLPEQARLALSTMEEVNDFSQAELIASQHQSHIHLLEALKPQPLTFRDDVNHIDSQIINNTSIHCQQRYAEKNAGKELEASDVRLPFNAKEWLSSLQTTIAKEPLVNAIS